MRPKLTHATIVPTAAMAIGTRTQLRREKARTAERRGGPARPVLNRPIMDALLKECWNLLGVIGAANLVLVDGRRFRFRAGGNAECANDVNLEDGSGFAGGALSVCARPWLAPYELTGDVDVVALLEGLRNDGALAKEGDGKELAVLHSSSLRIVEPALRKPCAHKLTASDIGDRRLVGKVPGKSNLVKNFH